VETLLVVTNPDSSIQNPAAIHITKNPHTKNENVLNIYAISASTSAKADGINNNDDNIVKKTILLNIIFPP
jgi:hypothetical protein